MKKDIVLLGDCIEILKEFEDNSVDSVITDPPFFIPANHYQSRIDWGRKWSDMSVLEGWWGLVCDEITRVLKPEGHFLTFCNADSYPAFYPAMFNRWGILKCLVWDKERVGLGRIWRHQHELIIAARNKGAYEPNDHKLRTDVIKVKATLSRNRKHPVEKPVELLKELIVATTPENGVVLDPFAGGGTTLLAAKEVGRSFIGIEKDKSYYDLIQSRIGA